MSRRPVVGLSGLLLVAACSAPSPVGPYPGEPFVDEAGEMVPSSRLALYADECPGRESAALLDVDWPLIDAPGIESEFRRYARDPADVMPTTRLMAPYDPAGSLPREARYTGFRSGPFHLWVGADDAVYLYLVDGSRVEALPRVAGDELPCP